MSWWGKVIGGTLGAAVAGPLGAMLGAAIGHGFDSGLKGIERDDAQAANPLEYAERSKLSFFTATFLVMGHLAKADGQVSEREIAKARHIMSRMQLNDGQKQAAMRLFNEGKSVGFDLAAVLRQLVNDCGRQKNLLQMFLEIQVMTALADDELHPHERTILLDLAQTLKFSRMQFEMLLAQVTVQHGRRHEEAPRREAADSFVRADEAYRLLGLTEHCSDEELKRAYRRQISQHHPDKLVSKGLPEEMMRLATDRTRQIKDAYELLRTHRITNNRG